MVRELLLITNRKSIDIDLDDLELRNRPRFAFLTEFDRFSGRLYHSG